MDDDYDIYSNEQIKEFEQFYGRLLELHDEVMWVVKNPTVGDVGSISIKKLAEKVLGTIKKYKEKVPEEFREKFSLDLNKLEKEVLNLQEDFIKNQS